MWRPCGESLNLAFALQRHKALTAGMMVWDVIAYNTRSPLVLIRGTMTAPGDKSSSWTSIRSDLNDAGVSLSSKTIRSRLADVSLKGNSPELDPLENLWYRLKTLVRMRYPRNKKELIADIIVSWLHLITKEELKTIFISMKHRCEAVIKNKGNLTKL
ncbi:transposable element Tcb1 transposase [Trichonephila clavipes]|nr:transposable element Tcb1 transposase [Trichonephila clavipes]